MKYKFSKKTLVHNFEFEGKTKVLVKGKLFIKLLIKITINMKL